MHIFKSFSLCSSKMGIPLLHQSQTSLFASTPLNYSFYLSVLPSVLSINLQAIMSLNDSICPLIQLVSRLLSTWQSSIPHYGGMDPKECQFWIHAHHCHINHMVICNLFNHGIRKYIPLNCFIFLIFIFEWEILVRGYGLLWLWH